MHSAAADVVGILGVAGKAMLAPLPINDFGVGRRVLSFLEEILDLIYSIVHVTVSLHSQYASNEKKRREPQPSKNAASQL